MTLKNRVILTFVCSIVLTVGLVGLLAFAYVQNFPTWSTLLIFLLVIVAIITWVLYYMFFTKYKDELNPHKNKGKGNRKNRRK